MRDATARRLSTLHTTAYRLTKGRIGRRFVNNDMLLLTTRGRRSGRDHTVPLLYLRDGADAIVIASWGGRDHPPHWYSNLEREPRVRVQIDGARYTAVAEPLDEPDRTTWWLRAVEAYDGYRRYQRRTSRVIPVVRLRVDQEVPHRP